MHINHCFANNKNKWIFARRANSLNSFVSIFIGLLLVACLPSCGEYNPMHLGFSKLEQVKKEGKLNVITRYSPTTYFKTQDGEIKGFEYDLVELFAEHLQVEVNYIIPKRFDDILSKIAKNKADIAAAGITITDERLNKIRFGPAYQSIKEQLVYRSGRKRPRKITDLYTGILEVVKGSSYEKSLIDIKSKRLELSWNVNTELSTNSLMYLVNEGLIDYTIADSHQANSIKRFYPKLSIAFDITGLRQLAWAMPLSDDNSLYDEVGRFFNKITENGTLENLLDKYYGNTDTLDYVSNCKFRLHMESRLSDFQHLFKLEAKKHDIDWRLLAAISYQESHWDADAVSPTGVRGLMMLTKGTAKQLGVKDRTDPAQSVAGGSLYFRQRLNRMPPRIDEADRVAFALASYNVGIGHLEDARILTQERKANPDTWIEVKETLPLLSKKQWYEKTKHGYARGKEPVQYVDNIRSYYELLIWLTEEDQIEKRVMKHNKEKPETVKNTALSIQPSIL